MKDLDYEKVVATGGAVSPCPEMVADYILGFDIPIKSLTDFFSLKTEQDSNGRS